MARVLVNLLSYTGLKGGMERYTRELYRCFGRMDTGHEWIGFGSRQIIEQGAEWFPGDILPSGIDGENRIQWAWGELFSVSSAARRYNAELVHSPATLGPWRTSAPAVYTMHDMLYFSLPDLMAVKAYNRPVQWMERRAASNASHILTDSDASKREIVKYLRYPAERTHVVHLGATPPASSFGRVSPRERALFLATGQRLKHKNFEGLVRAMALIPEDDRPQLVITGSFKEDPLIPIVDALDLRTWVDLRGWVPQSELDWLTHHATALVIPGFHDGYSLPMVEAMAVGLPVLASNAAVFQEIGGDAVTYFDPHDEAAIAAALIAAVGDPESLSVSAKRGLQRAKLFTWERTAQQTLAVFEMALDEGRAR